MPLYPPQMTSSPINLHDHGVHASPKGNADNVLLHIPAGKSNTYTYNIPKSMPSVLPQAVSYYDGFFVSPQPSRPMRWPFRDRRVTRRK